MLTSGHLNEKSREATSSLACIPRLSDEVHNCKLVYWEIFVYNICLISISNTVSDGATNKSVLNIECS